MSVYSSAASSGGGARPSRPGKPAADGEGEGDDYLDQRQSLEAGVFGVLFTLSKEKSENNWKFVLTKAVLDFWQLFVTVIDPGQGWSINEDSLVWKIVEVWNFTFLQDQGYKVYVAILYCVVGLLVLNLALCVWVAVSFKKRQFDYVWPIQVLRIFTSVFFQVFDIASLNLLQLGISCQYMGVDSDVKGHMLLFPDVACISMPHLIHLVVSALTLVVFVLVALLLNMSEVELNPLSKRPSGTGHSWPEVFGFAIKACMTLVTAFFTPGWMRVASILLTALAGLLTWLYFRWSPHMVGWINHVKVGTYASVACCSLLAVINLFHPGVKSEDMDSFHDSMTKAMLALIAPEILIGAAVSYWRLRRYSTKVQTKYKEAPSDANPKDVYEFEDPRDVEIAARVTRKWIKRDQVDHEAAAQAETIIKAGLFLFPTDAYMTLIYANYLIDVKDNAPAGYRQLQAAGKLKPNAMCRFMIFVREQEQQQRASSGSSGGGGQIDLVSYVEFQKSQRMVMRHHKEALLAICAFWQCLLRNHVSFKSLAQALNKIEKSVSNAEAAYKDALERYTDSYKLMRLYGKFLQMVKNDPWRATEFFEEAERLESKQQEEGSGPGQQGMPRVDDNNTAVLIITSKGAIQLYNKATTALFGYKKGDLEGKNVNMLIPAPFSIKHTSMVLNYASTNMVLGKDSPVVGKTRPVLGLHAERYGFVVKLTVTKASGTGEDANFMGLMEGVAGDPNMCLAWVMPGGIISCVDQHFGMWFGYSPAELLGTQFANLMKVAPTAPGADAVEPEAMLQKLFEECDTKPPPPPLAADQLPPLDPSTVAQGLSISHKYGGSMAVHACVWPSGTAVLPLYMIMLRRLAPEPSLMLVSDVKGTLRHISSDLSMLLGYASGIPNLESFKLMDLMPPTWATMHFPKWLKDQDPVIPAYSCRAASTLTHQLLDLKGKPVPVRMTVQTNDESGEPLHIVRMFKTTPQQALDDRRMQVTIDHRGVIMAVLSSSPTALFGTDPKALVGKPLHSIVPLLADPQANGGVDMLPVSHSPRDEFHAMGLDAFATPVLNALIKKAMDRPGFSWRVGVSAPGGEAAIRRQVKDAGLAQTMLAKICRPAVMQMDVHTSETPVFNVIEDQSGRPGTASSHLSVVVTLWRADLLSTCVEVDKDGSIMRIEHEDVCPPGLLFGVPTARLRGEALLQFMGASSLVDLGAEPEKKGGLKSSAAAQAGAKINPPRVLAGCIHYDQQPLSISSQVVVKGNKRWVMLNVSKPSRGSASALAALLPSNASFQRQSLGGNTHLHLQQQQVPRLAIGAPPGSPTSPRLSPSPIPPPPTVTPMGPVRLTAVPPVAGRNSGSGRIPAPPGSPPGTPPSRNLRPPATAPPVLNAPAVGGLSFTDRANKDASDSTGQMVRDVMVHPDSAYLAVGSSSHATRTRFNLPETVKEGEEVPAVATARSGAVAQSTAWADGGGGDVDAAAAASSAGLGAHIGDDDTMQTRPLKDSKEDYEGGSEGGSEGGKKALSTVKMARISTWVATDGEQYPVGGQTDVEPNSKVAKGLMAGVTEEARLNDTGEEEEEDEGDMLLADAGILPPARPRRQLDDSVMGPQRQGSSLGMILGKHNRVAPAPRARISSPGNGSSRGMRKLAASPSLRAPSAQEGLWPASGPVNSQDQQEDDEEGGGGNGGDGDDGRSEGGDSGGSGASKMSGMSGVSGASGDDGHDYRRGKRYRKLSKMLDGTEAQKVTNRFKVHTLCLIGLLMLVQTVSFAMMVVKINEQTTSMHSLSSSGFVNRFNMEINLFIRTIDNVLTNNTAPGLYREGLQYYLDTVATANEQMKTNNEFIYFEMNNMQGLDDSYGLHTAFDLKMRSVYLYTDGRGTDFYTQMSLWELLNRYQGSVYNYLHNYNEYFQLHNTTATMDDFVFIKNNGMALYSYYREVLDALLYRAVDNTNSVNTLHIIFLVLEGCVLCFIVSLYYAILLRQVGNQRYALYSVFIIIPVGLVRALAHQSVKLLDDSDSEGEEGEDDMGDSRGPKSQEVPDARALNKEVRESLRRKRTADLEGNGGMRTSNNGGMRPSSNGPVVTTMNINMKADKGRLPLRMGFKQRVAARMRKLLGMAEPPTSGKRQLVRDNRETVWLMLPILLWGMLVVVIYAIGYVKLEGISGPVADQNICNFVAGRSLRAAYWAQELVTLGPQGPTDLAKLQTSVEAYTKRLENAVRVLLVGEEAFALYGVNESFPMADKGITYAGASLSRLLYATDTCLRLDQTKCRGEEDSYYAITRQGVVVMMQRYLDQLYILGNRTLDELRQAPMDNKYFQYIWNVGTLDLEDGLLQVVQTHEDTIVQLFSEVRTLHIILFVLGWIFAIAFLSFMLRPMLRRSRREAKRVAELLSQLPPELNVEKLVVATLKVQASGKEGPAAAKGFDQHADKDWGKIVRSGSGNVKPAKQE